MSTSTQQKWSYDSSNFATMVVASSGASTLANSGGNFTIDSAGDIILDGAGNNVTMKAGGSDSLDFIHSSGDWTIKNTAGDKDIIFNIKDNTTDTEVMRLDGSTSRIGIGTSTPATKLDVNGTVKATAFTGPLTGAVTGNADTATTLANIRNIGGVGFNGSADINLPGVNIAGDQNTTGTSAGVSKSGVTAIASETKSTWVGPINISGSGDSGTYPLFTGSFYGSTYPTIQLNASPGSIGFTSNFGIYLSNTGSSSSTGQPTERLRFYSTTGIGLNDKTGAEKIRMLDNGNLGIGVSDPGFKLEVLSTTTQQKWSYDGDSFSTMTVAQDSNTTLATGQSGTLTLDVAGDIVLDAAGDNIMFKNAGTQILKFTNNSGNCTITNGAADKDIIFKDAGGNTIFTIDGSAESILMASGKKIEFADTGEYISGDTNDLNIASGRHILLSSTNNVGIGIAIPEEKLHIGGANTSLLFKGTWNSGNYHRVMGYGSSKRLEFHYDNGTSLHDNKQITLNTDSSERLRITTAGNVGIGVTDPDSKLEVAGNIHLSAETTTPSDPGVGNGGILYTKADGKIYWISNDLGETDLTATGGGGGGSGEKISEGHAVVECFNNSNNDFITFSTSSDDSNSVERMRIDKDGNVGIGLSDPDTKLEILSTSTQQKWSYDNSNSVVMSVVDGGAYLGYSNTNSFTIDSGQGQGIKSTSNIKFDIDTDNNDNDADRYISFTAHNNNVTLMNIRGNGFVGIRTFDPKGPLHIKQYSDDGGSGLDAESNAAIILERAASSPNNNKWYMGHNANNDLQFWYNSNDRGYFQNGTNVGRITGTSNFTGQHRSMYKEENINNIKNMEGLIVSANKNSYTSMSGSLTKGLKCYYNK